MDWPVLEKIEKISGDKQNKNKRKWCQKWVGHWPPRFRRHWYQSSPQPSKSIVSALALEEKYQQEMHISLHSYFYVDYITYIISGAQR